MCAVEPAPVLVGSFDPMRRKDERAINRTGEGEHVYKPRGRKQFAWKYGLHGHRRLRQEDAVRVDVYVS